MSARGAHGGRRSLSVHTRDADEALRVAAEVYFPHRFTMVRDPRRFHMRLDAVRIGPLEAGLLTYGVELRLETGDLTTGYEVNVPLGDDHLDTTVGRAHVTADAGTAAVYRPIDETSLHGWYTGTPLFGMKIDRTALEAELAQILGRPVESVVEFQPSLDLRRGAGAQWWRLVRPVIDLIRQPDGLARHPLVVEPLAHSVLAGLLFAVPHQYRAELEVDAEPARPGVIRRAIELLDADPGEPHTVTGIARACGVSARSLQAGFRRYVGVPPMTYLRQLRLRRAHADLCTADPALVGVAEVAWRWGFGHLGRFAAAYREVYGCNPSETLRRSTAARS